MAVADVELQTVEPARGGESGAGAGRKGVNGAFEGRVGICVIEQSGGGGGNKLGQKGILFLVDERGKRKEG